MEGKPILTIHAHEHSLAIHKADGDSTITFKIDASQTPTLAPFVLIEKGTNFKVTIEIEK